MNKIPPETTKSKTKKKGKYSIAHVTFFQKSLAQRYYLFTICRKIQSSNYGIYMTEFYINHSKFEHDTLQNHVTGVVYRTDLLKHIRFNENRNVGEDMEFNEEVRKLNPTCITIPCQYYYNYGANKDCLSYRCARDEIGEFIEGSDV